MWYPQGHSAFPKHAFVICRSWSVFTESVWHFRLHLCLLKFCDRFRTESNVTRPNTQAYPNIYTHAYTYVQGQNKTFDIDERRTQSKFRNLLTTEHLRESELEYGLDITSYMLDLTFSESNIIIIVIRAFSSYTKVKATNFRLPFIAFGNTLLHETPSLHIVHHQSSFIFSWSIPCLLPVWMPLNNISCSAAWKFPKCVSHPSPSSLSSLL